MSRIALGIGLLLWAAPAATQEMSAEAALARTETLTGVDADGCTRPQRADEILVCGTPEINREQMLPYAMSNAGARNTRGEVPRASAAAVQTGSCGVIQDGRPCNRGIDLLGIAIPFAIKLATKLIDPGAEVEPVPVIPRARY